jgi:hypothetical protein
MKSYLLGKITVLVRCFAKVRIPNHVDRGNDSNYNCCVKGMNKNVFTFAVFS